MGDLAKIEGFCELSTTNLTFKRDVSKEEWMDVFKALKRVEGCVQFWIGDCLAYRQQKWGMYDDIAEETGYADRTLRLVKETAEKIESGRRLPELSFSHHIVLTSGQFNIKGKKSTSKWKFILDSSPRSCQPATEWLDTFYPHGATLKRGSEVPKENLGKMPVTKKESARVLARQQYCCCVRPQFATVFPWNHPNGIYITQHLYKSNLRHFLGDLRHSGQK